MKMSIEHYNIIKNQINNLDREKVVAHKNLKLGKDIAKRFRWDLFHAAKLSQFACDHLYSYLNDNHIETALKQVIKDLKL